MTLPVDEDDDEEREFAIAVDFVEIADDALYVAGRIPVKDRCREGHDGRYCLCRYSQTDFKLLASQTEIRAEPNGHYDLDDVTTCMSPAAGIIAVMEIGGNDRGHWTNIFFFDSQTLELVNELNWASESGPLMCPLFMCATEDGEFYFYSDHKFCEESHPPFVSVLSGSCLSEGYTEPVRIFDVDWDDPDDPGLHQMVVASGRFYSEIWKWNLESGRSVAEGISVADLEGNLLYTCKYTWILPPGHTSIWQMFVHGEHLLLNLQGQTLLRLEGL